MGRRGAATCGTCKDRGISCDGSTPTCHSLRLSWPRASDRRRAMVVKPPTAPPPTGVNVARVSDARFVNISSSDVELHRSLANSSPGHSARSRLDVPSSVWNPFELEVLDWELFEYFHHVASRSLATFGQDSADVGEVLIRIALTSNTASSKALLRALLAFASVHRYGMNAQAVELKITSLRNLAEASSETNQALSPAETVEHAATAMVLCSFEIHHVSCTSGQWMMYICNAKKVIDVFCASNLRGLGPEVTAVLDWVHYHDVLTRFSLRHWNREEVDVVLTTSKEVFWTKDSLMDTSAFSMLELLSKICDAIPMDTAPPENTNKDEFKGFLNVLSWRIRSVPISQSLTDSDSRSGGDAALLLQLYQLAMLLYLSRACEDVLNEPTRTQQHVDRAFSISMRLSSCRPQFPVFILGCEARTDEQRVALLDLIARTEKGNSRSYGYTKMQLQAIWAQDDLADGHSISYWDKLTSIMSRCAILPNFV